MVKALIVLVYYPCNSGEKFTGKTAAIGMMGRVSRNRGGLTGWLGATLVAEVVERVPNLLGQRPKEGP